MTAAVSAHARTLGGEAALALPRLPRARDETSASDSAVEERVGRSLMVAVGQGRGRGQGG